MAYSRFAILGLLGVMLTAAAGCRPSRTQAPHTERPAQREGAVPRDQIPLAEPAAEANPAKEVKPPRGVVIRDTTDIRVQSDKSRPGARKLGTLGCGEVVHMLGEREGLQVKVQARGLTGWVYEDRVVSLSGSCPAARLMIAAREWEEPKFPARGRNDLFALALYSRLLELFPDSRYRPLALWRFGQIGERLAVEATKRAEKELTAKEKQSDESFIHWKGLDRYQRWGLGVEFSHLGHTYYHAGDAYRKIVKEHPNSEWADNAAYELLRLRRAHQPWEGRPKGPRQQSASWTEFSRKYPRSELKPNALVEMVYLNRVLHEIYCHSYEFADPAKARDHRKAAEELCQSVMREFPGSEHAARAENHLAELADGRKLYFFWGSTRGGACDSAPHATRRQ